VKENRKRKTEKQKHRRESLAIAKRFNGTSARGSASLPSSSLSNIKYDEKFLLPALCSLIKAIFHVIYFFKINLK
jgi:hypothetical protein